MSEPIPFHEPLADWVQLDAGGAPSSHRGFRVGVLTITAPSRVVEVSRSRDVVTFGTDASDAAVEIDAAAIDHMIAALQALKAPVRSDLIDRAAAFDTTP